MVDLLTQNKSEEIHPRTPLKEEPAFVIVVMRPSVFAVSASGTLTHLVKDWEAMDGWQRQLVH